MEKLYDRADIYDLIENEDRANIVRNDWKALLAGRAVATLLDVSIGAGAMTLPLQELGVTVFGSDLSSSMLEKCREKAAAKGKPLELKCCDFRDLSACLTAWQARETPWAMCQTRTWPIPFPKWTPM